MIIGIIKILFEFLKLMPRYLIALGITAAFLLFGSEKILKILSIYEFTQNYRSWLGLILILVSALLLVTIIAEITQRSKGWWYKRKLSNRITQRLNSLTEDEKQVLRQYIFKQTKTNYFRIQDGIVQGLESDGIIYRSARLGDLIRGFAYNISDIAWDYLNIKPHLLESSTDEPDRRKNK